MTENEIAKIVVDAAYHIHRKLGPGLLESVYEVILAYALNIRGRMAFFRLPIDRSVTSRLTCRIICGRISS
ncbi:MAG: GxxExxY protein [Desulfobacteraceae bacterium]|nr:GxxExxY protein [Desulfobacteraceae bacterium]